MRAIQDLRDVRGSAPAVIRHTRVNIFSPTDFETIIGCGFTPEKGLPKILAMLPSRLSIEALECFLLFYENPEGSDRRGYEIRTHSLTGIMGGRPFTQLNEAVNELKYIGATYLAAPKRDYVKKVEDSGGGFTFRSVGYSHDPLILTQRHLIDNVVAAFEEMGCVVSR